jgi:Tfp pilus assembly protein PilX
MTRRLRGDRGTGLVAALVLLFSFTAAGVILLARDYDDRLATRSVAQAIAFQAARSGAQQLDVESLRDAGAVRLDTAAATARARSTARRLLADHDARGSVSVQVVGDRVTVVVEILDVIEDGFPGSRRATVRAEGSARPVSG